MTEQEITPEQREAIQALMKECKSEVNRTVLFNLLLLVGLSFANVAVGKYLELDKTAVTIIQILTGIMVGSSLYRQLLDISDAFVLEGQKILNNKQ